MLRQVRKGSFAPDVSRSGRFMNPAQTSTCEETGAQGGLAAKSPECLWRLTLGKMPVKVRWVLWETTCGRRLTERAQNFGEQGRVASWNPSFEFFEHRRTLTVHVRTVFGRTFNCGRKVTSDHKATTFAVFPEVRMCKQCTTSRSGMSVDLCRLLKLHGGLW